MKKDVSFGMDSFGKPKILTAKETVANLITNILYLRPGQLPSMPSVGINIEQYLYAIPEDSTLSNLRELIATQCNSLLPNLGIQGVSVGPIRYNNRDTILIVIPVYIEDSSETLLVGVSKDEDGRVIFKYDFDKSII